MLSAAEQAASGARDFTSSLGLVVKSDGTIQDAIPNMAAYESGLGPYMRIVGVNGQQFSVDELHRAVRTSSLNSGSIVILVSNTGYLENHPIDYHSGIRYPHLERVRSGASRALGCTHELYPA
ncbi:MAG TPA: hypothetical protein VFA76_14440 [Terriglobales bacterium]|nr:hypothetical protein [Terriglobales bacterium]